MLRKLVERLSRGTVLQRRLPMRSGGDRVYVSPDAALQYWKWNLETGSKLLFDFAEQYVRPGDVVWDIGANVGLFTFAAAYAAGPHGKIVAVEADVFLVELLHKSVAARSRDRAEVMVLPVAVSDDIAIAQFHIARRGRSTNHLACSEGSTQTGGVRETNSVMTITLDWLANQLAPPRVLKIDVEGAESRVLQGAEQILVRTKPVVLCEISEQNADTCTQFLRAHGYTLYDFDRPDRAKIARASFNTLAVCEH